MAKINDRITFKAEKEKGEIVNLSFVNDSIMHTTMHKVASSFIDKSLKKPDERVASGFYHLYEKIAKYISCTDIAFANLETPLARNLTPERMFDDEGRYVTVEKEIPEDVLHDNEVYGSSYGNFNVHPAFALALKKVGFKIVNTANNHTADRLSNGIDRTIETLNRYGIDHFGTISYKQLMEKQAKDAWEFKPYIIKEIKGIKIALFGATSFVNYKLIPNNKTDRYNQIYKLGKDSLFSRYNGKNIPRMLEWIKEARDTDGADVIVIYLHWGLPYFNKRDGHSPDFLQKKWSKEVFEGGADIIIGGHTHTLQHGRKYITRDGRETFVTYSLGNFLTDYEYYNYTASAILYTTLVKNSEGVFIKKIKYLPTCSLIKRENKEIIDLQAVPVDKYERFHYLYDHYNNILGKHNLVSSVDIEKEYNLT